MNAKIANLVKDSFDKVFGTQNFVEEPEGRGNGVCVSTVKMLDKCHGVQGKKLESPGK